MSRHFMGERFDSKSASTPFSGRSWAIYLIQKRHDIEEMTNASKYHAARSCDWVERLSGAKGLPI
jgi:hypothetical protein